LNFHGCRSIELPPEAFTFYHTHNGAELDLLWQHNGKNRGIECKLSDAPSLTKSMTTVAADLNLEHLWIIYPGKDEWELNDAISVKSIYTIGETWEYRARS
jgi:hypothetical protein